MNCRATTCSSVQYHVHNDIVRAVVDQGVVVAFVLLDFSSAINTVDSSAHFPVKVFTHRSLTRLVPAVPSNRYLLLDRMFVLLRTLRHFQPVAATLHQDELYYRVNIDRTGRRVAGELGIGNLGAHWGWGDFFRIFKKKITGFYAFCIPKNYTCGQKPGPGGSIWARGRRCKTKGRLKYSRGSIPRHFPHCQLAPFNSGE